MYKNFKNKDGCILADDMGLGKTVQISVYLTSLKFQNLINKAIIVVPATLLDYWYNEIQRWVPSNKSVKIIILNGCPKDRSKIVQNLRTKKCIAIASPGSFSQDYIMMQETCKWDLLVIDEGHRAKNVHTKFR